MATTVVPQAQNQPPSVANVPATAQTNVMAPSYPMASLYVGDLHPEVTEAMLFDKFGTSGPVLSIRVCRDAITRRSLGYGYVNFQQPADAERALDTMNFDMMMNKPIRIMWSQRDPSIRRSGNGNVFIKNLDKHIDAKAFYDTFSMFGTILSCKVANDSEGQSKGYGFIHFETEESAQNAIEKINGMLIEGKKVFVGKFQPRASRMKELGESSHNFTNIYVKNFDETLDDTGLQELFSKYGKINSARVMIDSSGKPKGFGFVAFDEPESAEQAVNEMNDAPVPGKPDKRFTVCRAQKKNERQAELKRRYEQQKAERMQRYMGVNLYVKNLDEDITDDKLRITFESYGNITSAKVMCDENGRSRGFGFVCFEKPDDATKGVVDMNNKMLGNKPLYVALAQRKEDRKALLASQYIQRLAAMRSQNMAAAGMSNTTAMYAPATGGFYMPNPMQTQRNAAAAAFMQTQAMPGAQMRGGPGAPRWSAAGMGNAGFSQMQPGYVYSQPGGFNQINRAPRQNNQIRSGYGNQQYRPPNRTYQGQQFSNQGPRYMQQKGNAPQMGYQSYQMGGGGGGGMQQSRMQHTQQQYSTVPAGIVLQNQQDPLNAQILAQAQPQEQKQMIGERLYPLIKQQFSKDGTDTDIGKITGMMLEMDNSELLMMLENEELLRQKVQEAATVLVRSNQ